MARVRAAMLRANARDFFDFFVMDCLGPNSLRAGIWRNSSPWKCVPGRGSHAITDRLIRLNGWVSYDLERIDFRAGCAKSERSGSAGCHAIIFP